MICDNIGDLCREEGKFQSLFRKEAERRKDVRTHAMDAGFSFAKSGEIATPAKPLARLRRASSSELGSPSLVRMPVPLSVMTRKPETRDDKEREDTVGVRDEDRENLGAGDERKVLRTLAPLLFDLPPEEAEQFNRYRLEYQMYRKGQARGAKGEASSAALAASRQGANALAVEGMAVSSRRRSCCVPRSCEHSST